MANPEPRRAPQARPQQGGPFKVSKVCRPGSVHLATEEGVQLPNPWNIEHLRKFYP
jgi:hypothetical protein